MNNYKPIFIILAGGKGTRLEEVEPKGIPKPFKPLFKYKDTYESMVQRTWRQLVALDYPCWIITNNEYCEIYKDLIPFNNIIKEYKTLGTYHSARVTFENLKIKKEENLIFIPCDQYVQFDYYKQLANISEIVFKNQYELGAIGKSYNEFDHNYGYFLDNYFYEKPEKSDYELRNLGAWIIPKRTFDDYEFLSLHESKIPIDDKNKNNSIDYRIAGGSLGQGDSEKPIIYYEQFLGEWNDVGNIDSLREFKRKYPNRIKEGLNI